MTRISPPAGGAALPRQGAGTPADGGGVGLRIVVDGSGLERPRAGVGVYTTQILHALAVDRPDCRLTVFGPPGGFVHVPDAAYRLLPRMRLVGRHVQWPAEIRRMHPDAYFGPAGALPLGNVGSPSVITVHDLAIYRNPRWFPGRQPLSTRLVVPRSVLRADVVIAVSENTARDVAEIFGLDRARIQVVPHGVSPKFRPMGAEELADARARLGLPERFILFVGTIEPRKNLETLLDAWVLMRDRPDLVVVGSWGWLYGPIREKMARLGPRLHHLESVDPDELPAIYNLARVLAHPAWYEGFGLPPLEAMACGTPVVVSDRSSLPEVVQDAGIIVAAGEPDEWRKAMERVVGDTQLAADLRHRGILRAAQFSWERAARLTWRALDETVTRPAPH
jgi:glycosyltransferase involved in cell wall biosynthesis